MEKFRVTRWLESTPNEVAWCEAEAHRISAKGRFALVVHSIGGLKVAVFVAPSRDAAEIIRITSFTGKNDKEDSCNE